MNEDLQHTRQRTRRMDSASSKAYHTLDRDNEETKSKQHNDQRVIETKGKSLREREDVFLWFGGVAFIVILIGVVFGIGHARHWDAQSGHTHNESATSQERFLPEPYVPEPGVKGRHGVEADSRWYYWKLPSDRVTPFTRLFVWLCYIGHQMLAWTVLYLAQYHKATLPKPRRYTTRLTRWNYIAFCLHVFFHLLHLLQTHTTYDALAQDVSIASSQGSVIMILVFILLIEYRDRGIVFLWPTDHNQDKVSKKLRLDQAAFAFIRRYHGYGFAWGAIYTFWYHPMENTWGHALGFIHTWLIMLQGSLAFTDFHLNKYWRLLLEIWVTLHGTVVAIQTSGHKQLGTALWPMFCFGFSFLIVFTQVFGLPFWRQIHWSFRVIPPVVYFAVTLYMYSWIPDAQGRTWVRLQEIIRIPAVYYLGFIYAWLLFYLFLKLETRLRGDKNSPSLLKTAVCLLFVLAIFVIFVGVSTFVQVFDVQVGLIILMIVFVFVFVTGVCIGCVVMNQTVPSVNLGGENSDTFAKKNAVGNMSAQDGENSVVIKTL